MFKKHAALALLASALTACPTVGQLTVKDYQAKSGQRVMAWVGASERVTAVAVDSAPQKGANYAYVMTPAQVTFGSLNVNAFADAQVAYYRCANLPS